jgi:Sulfatase-modifying factor enzyme 1/Putative metal-binding motif
LVVLLVGSTGCHIDPYHIGVDQDGGGDHQPDARIADDGGPINPDADLSPDANLGPDACVPEPEICDHKDQDCDGVPDNGFDLTSNPSHCGECNNACSLPGSKGTCESSQCQFECLPGFHDLDPNDPGCEYACIATNGGVEQCDGFDNDCDGLIDEDFDLDTDENNCGACGKPCLVQHATAACTGGQCGFGACDPGFADLFPGVPGCEYQCPVFPPVAESCNNIDDDCDGQIDDGNPGGGVACGTETGECVAGTTTCQFGTQVCVNQVGPATETCDNKDNDCDGAIDDGFDKQNDPLHCGSCNPCNLAHAVPKCTTGQCKVNFCLPGFINFDGQDANGCEFQCTPTGPEVCDGIDNDCDKLVDAADPSMAAAPAGLCRTQGACAGATPVCGTTACDSHVGFHCAYGAGVEKDVCGNPVLQETRCDGKDGDCDGAVDDAFPLKGSACGDDKLGVCKGSGSFVCNTAQTGLSCNITSPGASPSSETCNNLDDDCDGSVDEGAPDEMVHVTGSGQDFYIYKYEASRPDATAGSAGAADHRSCSKVNVQPWRSVDFVEAAQACADAGRRLCTEAEWQLACAGAAGLTFPYGNTYDANACNGNDHDANCSGVDEDMCLPTGTNYDCPGAPTSPQCVSTFGAFDLSGNLKEWTATQVSSSPEAYRIRGGAFDSIAPGLTCQFNFVAAEPDYLFDNLGFRCCSNTP